MHLRSIPALFCDFLAGQARSLMFSILLSGGIRGKGREYEGIMANGAPGTCVPLSDPGTHEPRSG
jgi:hypothetical protein